MDNNFCKTEIRANKKSDGSKVLFLATVYTHLANFHIPYIRLLQDKGYDVHAAASSADGRRQEIEETGAFCHEIRFSRSPISTTNFRAFCQLITLFKSNYYVLIHVHTPIAAFLGRLAAKLTKQGSVLYTAHGFHFYKGAPLLDWLIYFIAEKIAARWTDCLITINEEDCINARKLGFKPDRNLFLVKGVGVDMERVSSFKDTAYLRKELGIPQDALIVVCVAELASVKNHAFLLDAWRELSSWRDNIYLLLTGTGKVEKKLKVRVKEEDISRVLFLGFRQDVQNILADSDLAILTSRREGLPRSIMEAMAAGKPVIVTDVRGSRDLVDDGRTGFIVKLGDLQGLIKTLKRLISDKNLRFECGSAGRLKVADYALKNVMIDMTRIYDCVLDKKHIESTDSR